MPAKRACGGARADCRKKYLTRLIFLFYNEKKSYRHGIASPAIRGSCLRKTLPPYGGLACGAPCHRTGAPSPAGARRPLCARKGAAAFARRPLCGGGCGAREAANAGPANPAMRRTRSTQTRKAGPKAAFRAPIPSTLKLQCYKLRKGGRLRMRCRGPR